LIEFRHTNGSFQPTMLENAALADCVEPRHIQGGALVFVTDPARHETVMRAARGLYPRHVMVEEALMEACVEAAENVKANRGRLVNEKSRHVIML